MKIFFHSPFLLAMSFLFFIPLVSGVWSSDVMKWWQIMKIKSPLLFFPLAFVALGDFRKKDWERIAWIFLCLVFAAVAWSFWQYLQNMKNIHEQYLKAQTILTPMGNDHVRFSLLVSIAVQTAFYLWFHNHKIFSKTFSAVLILFVISFIIYLHVLAARTGLFCLYVSIFIFIAWWLWQEKLNWRATVFFILLLSLPVMSYYAVPTFKNRIRYLQYDFSLAKKNVYVEGSNDGARSISLMAGWEILKKNFFGIGFGDIETESKEWSRQHYPNIKDTDQILPSSEWLMYGDGTGWPGVVLFTGVMLFPFFTLPIKKNVFWILINISIALSYLFDIGLEVQYGVFIHAFILLWWYYWLQAKKN